MQLNSQIAQLPVVRAWSVKRCHAVLRASLVRLWCSRTCRQVLSVIATHCGCLCYCWRCFLMLYACVFVTTARAAMICSWGSCSSLDRTGWSTSAATQPLRCVCTLRMGACAARIPKGVHICSQTNNGNESLLCPLVANNEAVYTGLNSMWILCSSPMDCLEHAESKQPMPLCLTERRVACRLRKSLSSFYFLIENGRLAVTVCGVSQRFSRTTKEAIDRLD